MRKIIFVLAAFGLLTYMIMREVDSASSASMASGGATSGRGSASSAQAASDAKRALASVKPGSGESSTLDSSNGLSNSGKNGGGSNQRSAQLTGARKSPNELAQIRETALAQLQKKASHVFEVRRDNFSDDVRTLQDGSLGNIIPAAFIAEYSENLFGVSASHLAETHRETTDRTKVVYTQQVDGIDVYGGTLTLFYEGNSLTRVQNDLVTNEARAAMPTSVSTSEMLAFLEQSARRSAEVRRDSLPTLQLTSSQQAKMIYYPSSTGLVHAYQIPVQEIRKDAKPVAYMAIVDAEHLRIIAKKPLNYE